MAALNGSWSFPVQIRTYIKRRAHGFRCCFAEPDARDKVTQTPLLLTVAVSGVTELLRLFSPVGRNRDVLTSNELESQITFSEVDDVLSIIKSDYEKAYFLTGKELYARNLSLLVPFFDNPSIELKNIVKGIDSEAESIVASWVLRTYLKLPWKPLICINGRTSYELDKDLRIIRHAEEWSSSALQAISQIFIPSSLRSDM